MKPENENHGHSADAFARELSSFRRAAPPEAWRDELLANAIPKSAHVSDPAPAGKGRRFTIRFNLQEKFFAGGLAAAWLAILGLWIATPDDSQSLKTGPAPFAEPSIPIRSDPFPMLAWRFSHNGEPGEILIP